MLNINSFMSSLEGAPTAGSPDASLKQRLSLYQVFLRLYEQNPTLLDEILNLEHANGENLLRAAAAPYVYGFVMNGRVGLVTNLMKGETQTVFQSQQIWTIGRDRRKSVIPIADERLSRCHAAIAYNQQVRAFYLIDFDSTNGSFVNGEEIRHPHCLRDGDRIRLGSLSFSFSLSNSIRTANSVASEIEKTVRQHFNNLGDEPDETMLDLPEVASESSGSPEKSPSPEPSSVTASEQSDSSPEVEVVIDDTLMFLRDTL